MAYDWDFSVIVPYAPAMFRGMLVSLWLSALVIVIGTPLGFLLGGVLGTRVVPVREVTQTAVDVVRSIPVLVLLLLSNYYLPVLLDAPRMSPFAIALTALTINLTCFVADLVRGAALHVDGAELDAARAVGLRESQVALRFAVPRIVRVTIPGLTLLCIATVKNSALASVIAVYELTHTASLVITERFRTLEALTVATGLYVLVLLPATRLARYLEATTSRWRIR